MHKLLSLSNKESKGQRMVGKTFMFEYYGSAFFFGDIKSSRVKSITFDEQECMIVKTRNSTYTFKRES